MSDTTQARLAELRERAERWKHSLTVNGSDLVTELIDLYESELSRVAGELDEAREEAQELAVELVNERILHNATTAEAAELRDALRECPCNCQWVAGQQTYHCRRCAALATSGQTDE